MKLNPTGNQVAIEPIEQAAKTAGGIDLPDQLIKLLDEGKVLELGPTVDQKRFINGIKVGDRVVYSRYAGDWVKLARGNDQLSEAQHNIKILEDRDIRCVPSEI